MLRKYIVALTDPPCMYLCLGNKYKMINGMSVGAITPNLASIAY